jgi:aryl-alcohol dehydrogenase-like predicted oxidoreductase
MRYKLFGRGTGLRVSELALGAGTFGTRWGYGAEPPEVRRMLDAYLAAGGNFIDTADGYQLGEAEEQLGELLAGRRNDVVLATKYTSSSVAKPSLTAVGNSRRVMIDSVEASLRRLRTDRIDLLWVHMPDGVTSSEEIMRGLDDLVRAGKVVYLGLSDFPAWRVARAATIAELRGWAPLAGIQIEYSLAERTPDRELLPMAQALGLGIAGWSPLGGGLLTGKYRRGEAGRAESFKRLIHSEEGDPRKSATVDAVLEIAEARGNSPAQVAIAWAAARGVVPILGPRTTEQLADNLGAAGLDLSAAELADLDEASRVPLGFPHELMAEEAQVTKLAGGVPDRVEKPAAPVA